MSAGFISGATTAGGGRGGSLYHHSSSSNYHHSRSNSSNSRRVCRRHASGGAVVMAVSDRTAVMVNGLPGKMAEAVAEAVVRRGLQLVPFALTGEQVQLSEVSIAGHGAPLRLVRPSAAAETLAQLKTQHPDLIAVDYTHPSACNGNAEAYSAAGIDFVMGTTGGDAAAMQKAAEAGGISAVIAPNMGKQIVAFQAAMEFIAENFPGAFGGYSMTVRESHQSTKADTSGTAKALVQLFNRMGPEFAVDEIQKVRVPEEQMEVMKVPEEHIKGHAFHTYHLTSADETVNFEFQHNVVGRKVYAEGTVDAVEFVARRRAVESAGPAVYSMIDILKEGAMS